MSRLTVYARREPTNDTILKQYAPEARRFDVVFYHDRDCTKFYGRWVWYMSPLPNRRRRTIVLNCFRYALEWRPATEVQTT